MRHSPVVCTLCMMMVVLAGCTSGGFPGVDWEIGMDGTPTPTPVCVYHDKGDPNIPDCLITERPADLFVENRDAAWHNVTVRILHNDSTAVFSETMSFRPGVNYRNEYEDVFDRPGVYTISATIDNTTTETATWNVGERYTGGGNVEWKIFIHGPEEIEIRRAVNF